MHGYLPDLLLSRGTFVNLRMRRLISGYAHVSLLQVVPCHFDPLLKLKPAEFREAFSFVDRGDNVVRSCDEDIAFLREALDGLPPNLALFPSLLGPLRGQPCGLVPPASA